MKKLISFSVIGMLLSIPFIANAALLGTGQLDVSWSTPVRNGYYADYDGRVTSSNFGYTTDWEEIFCVSRDHAHAVETVDFYAINSNLKTEPKLQYDSGLYEKLAQAAWIADHWTSLLTSNLTLSEIDVFKAEAQQAIWVVTEVIVTPNPSLSSGVNSLLAQASSHKGYSTNNWFFAHSPGGGTTANYQDYLTPVDPVPEPATMFLLGAGLLGLAGISRKKFKK